MTPYDAPSPQAPTALVDGFGRTVTYLRVSVTDRCDLRCVYCMAEHMTFLPKAQVLTRLNVTRAVRKAEQADLIEHHQPPMNQ